MNLPGVILPGTARGPSGRALTFSPAIWIGFPADVHSGDFWLERETTLGGWTPGRLAGHVAHSSLRFR